MRLKRRPSCPKCGGDKILPIVYGLPGQELFEASARGEVLLGGCIVDKSDPQWQCTSCGHGWGERDKP